MSDKKTGITYIEDEFDLEVFKKNCTKSVSAHSRVGNRIISHILSLIIILLSVIVAYLGYGILQHYYDLWRNRVAASRAREIAAPMVTPFVPSSELPSVTITPAPEETNESAPIPTTEQPKTVREYISVLRQTFENDNIIGFLSIADTNIEYAVAQGSDNDFYLYRDLYGQDNAAGSIFMDWNNSIDPLGSNTVIYGHNMRDRTMFHNLRYYSDKTYFENHRYITFQTAYENTAWEIFACYATTVDFNYIETNFPSQEIFWELAQKMKEKSIYDTGVTIYPSDKILTLSTCTNANPDERFAIHARLVNIE